MHTDRQQTVQTITTLILLCLRGTEWWFILAQELLSPLASYLTDFEVRVTWCTHSTRTDHHPCFTLVLATHSATHFGAHSKRTGTHALLQCGKHKDKAKTLCVYHNNPHPPSRCSTHPCFCALFVPLFQDPVLSSQLTQNHHRVFPLTLAFVPLFVPTLHSPLLFHRWL